MLIDGRYHIASLVAVFMAFGLGLLVGITAFSDDALLERQETMIAKLERQFAALQAERGELEAQLALITAQSEEYRKFAEEAKRLLISNRLQGERVVLLVCDTKPSAIEYVAKQLLGEAGAKVGGVWYLSPEWETAGWEYAQEAAAFAGRMGWTKGSLVEQIASGLAAQITSGPSPEVKQRLEKWGMATAVGLEAEPTDAVVFLLPTSSRKQTGDFRMLQLELIDELLSRGITVAVGRGGAWEKVPRDLNDRNVVLVEELETEIGQARFIDQLTRRRRQRP